MDELGEVTWPRRYLLASAIRSMIGRLGPSLAYRDVQEVQFLRNETSVAIELGLLCATCVPGPTGMESAGVPMFRRHWRCCALQYRPLSKMNCKASCPRPRIALPATKQHGIGFGASNAAGIHEREVNRE